jgi:hypothetical protein
MKTYDENQFGWWIFATLIPLQLIILYYFWKDAGPNSMGTSELTAVSLVIVVTVILFYRLNTKITPDLITVSFGIGLLRKRIPIKKIKSVTEVKNPWYFGWGIRFIPNGMMFNISGFNGVEIALNDSGRIIRIGTANSSQLKQEILKRLD